MNNKWWGDPKNAKDWIKQNEKRTKDNKGNNSTSLSTKIVLNEIKKNDYFDTILEVGSGDGRLIGEIFNKFKMSCDAIDINKKLLKHINKKYPDVSTHDGNIINLPFDDNTFDLVFTYQVLQHIHPEDIKQALSELQRICKKELWMFEGIGRVDYKNGDQTHKAHDGSWVWKIDEFINCTSEIPTYKKQILDRQRLYKFKK